MSNTPYSELAARQKKRRRIAVLQEIRTRIRNEDFAQGGSSLDFQNIVNHEQLQSSLTGEVEDNCSTQTHSYESEDKDLAEDSEGSLLGDNESETYSDEYLSIEDKLETIIINWLDECPNIPMLSVTKLLRHVHSFFPSIPLTPQALKKVKPPNVTVLEMHHGRYAHFNGWIESIANHLNHIKYSKDEIFITVNIDGIPLFNDNRNHHAYPILLKLGEKQFKIFCAGIYVSADAKSNKMPQVDVFTEKFVRDILKLSEEGIKVSNRYVKLNIKAFICDAPARADLKRIVGHSGYFSCERCTQKGVMAGGHVALLDSNAPKRSDVGFLTKEHSEHHKQGPIPTISELGIGMVTSFPLDYMHLCCLGIMKRLMTRWSSSKRAETKCHLTSAQKELIDNQLQAYSEHVPSEFKRKLNSGFQNYKFWKATEFRQFLVYAGFPILKDILPATLYANFLYLAISLRMLLTEGQQVNMKNVSTLLKTFVKGARKIYGDGFVSYNVHSLIHLPDDYCNFGPLDHISCFPFENYLGCYIKGRLTGRNKPLEQICRHVSAENDRVPTEKADCKESTKQFCIKNTLFTKGSGPGRDNCIITTSGKIGYIQSFSDVKVIMTQFQSDPLFTVPCSSEQAGIYKLTNGNAVAEVWKNEIVSKLIVVPLKEYLVGITMLQGSMT